LPQPPRRVVATPVPGLTLFPDAASVPPVGRCIGIEAQTLFQQGGETPPLQRVFRRGEVSSPPSGTDSQCADAGDRIRRHCPKKTDNRRVKHSAYPQIAVARSKGESMVLVAPDILDEVRQLPWFLLLIGLTLGLFLWLFGGRGHRFWLVLSMTVAGGVLGLIFGAAYAVQPLVAGLLLAAAAGTLALSLARVVLFVAGGASCVWLARTVAPAWDEPAVYFLVGGLMGVLLYKVWVTALCSLAGTLLIAYSILGLVALCGVNNVVRWADQQTAVLNWACGAFSMLGLLTQHLLERRRLRRQRALDAAREEAEEADYDPRSHWPPQSKRWWEWGRKKHSGRAA
jgi:hypothetical protein